MINDEHKFVFIHIPKTAGTSIEQSFISDAHINDVAHKHFTYRDVVVMNSDYLNYFKFTVVRNPWDIVCSLYNYMWKSDYQWPKKWRAMISSSAPSILNLSFTDWVKHPTFMNASLRSAQLFKPNDLKVDVLQSDWLSDSEGNIVMDVVCKFETLQDDFDFVCDKVGIQRRRLKHTNISKNSSYMDYYDSDSIEIVNKKYEKDIIAFNYSFEI